MTLDELEALAAKATPGPWRAGRVEHEGKVWAPYADGIAGPYGERCLLNMNLHFPHTADREFIAAARTEVPALIARVRKLEAENSTLRERVAKLDALWKAVMASIAADNEFLAADAIRYRNKRPFGGEMASRYDRAISARGEADRALNAAIAALEKGGG